MMRFQVVVIVRHHNVAGQADEELTGWLKLDAVSADQARERVTAQIGGLFPDHQAIVGTPWPIGLTASAGVP